jgi:hypothetical protein
MVYTTFSRCQALQCGAVDVGSDYDCDVEADCCLFASTEADLFAVMYSSTLGGMRAARTNFSHPRAKECVGCMERHHGLFCLEFSILSGASAKVHNGGFCVRELSALRVESCVFDKCRHSSVATESAAALLIYDNPFDSLLANSAFINNDPGESTTVTVVGGHQLLLSGCCFTGSRKVEIRDPNGLPDAAMFDAESCPTARWFPDGGIGFALNRREIALKSRRPRRPLPPKNAVPPPLSAALAPTAVACAGIAAILTAIQTLLRKACRDRIRVPAALL